LFEASKEGVDGRVKPGHDEEAETMLRAAANHAGPALPYALACN
jgi:hypothetical protein